MTRDLLFCTSLMFTIRVRISARIPTLDRAKTIARSVTDAGNAFEPAVPSESRGNDEMIELKRLRGQGEREVEKHASEHALCIKKRIHHEPLSHILDKIGCLLPVAQFLIRVDPASSARRVC